MSSGQLQGIRLLRRINFWLLRRMEVLQLTSQLIEIGTRESFVIFPMCHSNQTLNIQDLQ